MTSKVIKISEAMMNKLEAYQEELSKNGLQLSKQATLNYVMTAFFNGNPELPKVTRNIKKKTDVIKKDTDVIKKVTDSNQSSIKKTSSRLSEREEEALILKEKGLSNIEIAHQMSSRPQTVSGYIAKARKKKKIAGLAAVE